MRELSGAWEGAACPRGEVALAAIGDGTGEDGDGGDAADRILGSTRYADALPGSPALVSGEPLSGDAERSGKKRSIEER